MTSPARSADDITTAGRYLDRHAHLPPAFMTVGGAVCVILGGLAAAVTGPLGLSNGSWLAAYLVLVCGVGSCAIGFVQARSTPMPSVRAWTQLSCWLVGNVGVIVGSLTGIPAAVDAGALLLAIALLLALAHAGRTAVGPAGALTRWAYRCLLLLLLISVPVGALLAHLKVAG